jgi:WD40 repeat protein
MDPTGRTNPRKLRQGDRPLRQVCFWPGSATLVVAGDATKPETGGGAVRLIDVEDGRECGELDTALASVRSLSLSRDGLWLTVVGQGTDRKTVVQVWDVGTRARTHLFPADGAVGGQVFAGGTKLIVLIEMPPNDEEHAGILTLDLRDGRRVHSHPRIGSGPRFAVFSADESFLFAGGLNRCLSYYRVSRTTPVMQTDNSLHGHPEPINHAALSPDERRLATASDDETVRIWDRETSTELLVLRGDSSPMVDVAFSPAGGLLAAAQANGTIRVWDGRPKSASALLPR